MGTRTNGSHRRRLVGTGAAALLVLAACGSDDDDADSTTADSTEAGTDTTAGGGDETTAPADTTAPAGTAAPDDTAGGDASTLTVWTEDYYVSIFEPLVADWEAETGIDVEFVTKDFGTMVDDFISAVPVGEGPDVFIAPAATNNLVNNGVVAPVELGGRESEFAEVAIDGFTSNGVLYGVPFTVENIALYRNTELAPETPETFDEMIATGQQLVADGAASTAFGVGLDPTSGNPYLLMPLQSSFGSTLFARDADGNFDGSQLTIDDEAGIAFAEALGGWGASGAVNPDLTLDIALTQFTSGELPFLVTGPWDLATVKESGVPYAIDPIPSAGGEFAAPFVGFYGVYQSSQAANPIGASLFLTDFMTRTETQVGIWESAQNPPALTSAFEEVSSNPDMQAFGTVGQQAVPIPNIPEMDQVWGPWGETEMLILRGQGDPATLWREMAETIRSNIAGG